ncbi:MAG: hypothetical protein JW861_10085 [Bacteroidales bacterium]|nr:hypothetical protein [Bacteroidales bacterium]
MKSLNQVILIMALLVATLGTRSQSIERSVVASAGDYFAGANATLEWTLGEIATETFAAGNIILTQGFQQPVQVIITGIDVDLLVNLEGPYNGTDMNTNLIPALPLSQPYNTAPWNYTGTESVASLPNNNIVDWILIELRDAPSAAAATGATRVAQQAGFLLRNGTVTNLDGASPLNFNVTISQQLFAVVWHRNHLGIMSANPLTLVGGVYSYDFSSGVGQAYGGQLAHKNLGGGIYGMVGGDGNADKQVSNADKLDVWSIQAGQSGYWAGDFNMDIQVNNPDKNDIWAPNSGMGGQVPETLAAAPGIHSGHNHYSSQVPD